MKSQRGFAHILILLLLLAGLAVSVYLIGQKTNLFSRASNPPIVFKSSDGKPLPYTGDNIPLSNSFQVQIELTSTLGPALGGPGRHGTDRLEVSTASSTPEPTAQPLSLQGFRAAYGSKKGGSNYDAKYDSNNDGRIDTWDFSSLVAKLRSSNKQASSADTTGGTTAVEVGTVAYRLAENPSDIDKMPFSAYTKDPMVVGYQFKNATDGKKFIWAEFKDSNGKTDKRSAEIELKLDGGPGRGGTPNDPKDCDINGDGQVTNMDTTYWASCVRGSDDACRKLDFSHNEVVDQEDLDIFNYICPAIKYTFSGKFPTIPLSPTITVTVTPGTPTITAWPKPTIPKDLGWVGIGSYTFVKQGTTYLNQSFIKKDGHSTTNRVCAEDTNGINWDSCFWTISDLNYEPNLKGNVWADMSSYTFVKQGTTYLNQSFIKKDGHNTVNRTCVMGSNGINWDSCVWNTYDLNNETQLSGSSWIGMSSYIFKKQGSTYLNQSFIKNDGHNTANRTCPADDNGINWGSCVWGTYDLNNEPALNGGGSSGGGGGR